MGARAMGLWVVLAAAAGCVTETHLKDLCEDDAVCESDADCPIEPPNAGVDCDLGEGAACYYCSEGERVDASFYACSGARWMRNANVDCRP
jgi:hypothetical protein